MLDAVQLTQGFQ